MLFKHSKLTFHICFLIFCIVILSLGKIKKILKSWPVKNFYLNLGCKTSSMINVIATYQLVVINFNRFAFLRVCAIYFVFFLNFLFQT